jgi:hypothetical protein
MEYLDKKMFKLEKVIDNIYYNIIIIFNQY